MILKGRKIVGGEAQGETLVTTQPISFLGGVDPETSKIIEKNHELKNEITVGKILVFPFGKGSTVGSYVLYQLGKNNMAPAAIINQETEPIVAVGAALAKVPLIDHVAINKFQTGMFAKINADEGIIALEKKQNVKR